MTYISTGSVLQDSWQVLYDVITDKITDTDAEGRAGTEFVFSAWPNKIVTGSSKWVRYPIVVLTVDEDSRVNFTLGGTKRDSVLRATCDVYNLPLASGDKMMDQIERTLQDNQLALEGSGLKTFGIESMSSSEFTDLQEKKVWLKTLNFTYNFREDNP